MQKTAPGRAGIVVKLIWRSQDGGEGTIHRISFPSLPSWAALSEKASLFYGVPAHNLAIAYVDEDGDEIIMSSQTELDSYFGYPYLPVETNRIRVVDLAELRQSVLSRPRSR